VTTAWHHHLAVVQLVGDGFQSLCSAAADVLHHRRKVMGPLVSIKAHLDKTWRPMTPRVFLTDHLPGASMRRRRLAKGDEITDPAYFSAAFSVSKSFSARANVASIALLVPSSTAGFRMRYAEGVK
jgi:hypothetical protein